MAKLYIKERAMRVDLFDFELNKELIASKPENPRDASRLLDVTNDDCINDRHFYDLPNILQKGDVLVFNNTKVIPARLYGKRGLAEVEVTLYHPENGLTWWAFIKNSKRLKKDDVIVFYTAEILTENSTFKAKVLEKHGEDGVLIEFLCTADKLSNNLETYGLMPLPPYIKRDKPTNSIWNKYNDKEDYQTVYAKYEGAVAAPTAGLHFTKEILEELKNKGVEILYVTLHVGLGTFRPVKAEKIEDHQMHSEHYHLPKETANLINETKKNGGRVIAVGTTSCRTLESVGTFCGEIREDDRNTDIFIYPGYKFKCIDGLLTNFHLPESTLIMLVSAFYGYDKTLSAYKTAVDEKYRFFSFGDCMLIL